MKCIIITAYSECALRECMEYNGDETVICADNSYRKAFSEKIIPKLIIGDFDTGTSYDFPEKAEVIKVPREKDDTDTLLCIKEAVKRGFDDITIVGGIGGRLDHTVANLQSLLYASENDIKICMRDNRNIVFIVSDSIIIPKKDGFYLSVFAFGGKACGVTVSGVKYPLRDAVISPDYPLGVSNVITSEAAEIKVVKGTLLVVQSRD